MPSFRCIGIRFHESATSAVGSRDGLGSTDSYLGVCQSLSLFGIMGLSSIFCMFSETANFVAIRHLQRRTLGFEAEKLDASRVVHSLITYSRALLNVRFTPQVRESFWFYGKCLLPVRSLREAPGEITNLAASHILSLKTREQCGRHFPRILEPLSFFIARVIHRRRAFYQLDAELPPQYTCTRCSIYPLILDAVPPRTLQDHGSIDNRHSRHTRRLPHRPCILTWCDPATYVPHFPQRNRISTVQGTTWL